MRNAVVEKFGGVDILINAAGAIFAGDIENTYPQDFDYLMDVNMRTPFLLSQFFLPFLK
jgi:NAD(P)-dependent dehydrogenase (short-subunit alcohol dehydrogenase family)